MPEVLAFPSIPTRILLPIDFTSSSHSSLKMAADLAQHFHAELCLVKIIPFFPTTVPRFGVAVAKASVEVPTHECNDHYYPRTTQSAGKTGSGHRLEGAHER
jgi:hypothetical protein